MVERFLRLFGPDYAFGDKGLVKRPVPAPTRSPASRQHEPSQILDCEAEKPLARKPRVSTGQGRVRSGAVRHEAFPHQRHPRGLPRFLRQARPRGRALGSARAAPRSHSDVYQCGHGAVQECVHRPGEAIEPPRGLRTEMRAGRRQAQRSRQCRLYRAPSHLLRDARQFLLRRLFQGARHPARLGASDPRLCPR